MSTKHWSKFKVTRKLEFLQRFCDKYFILIESLSLKENLKQTYFNDLFDPLLFPRRLNV